LRAADLVEHRSGEGYQLTSLGRELMAAFTPLYAFADRWAKRSKTDE
jgi:DNA-binding HxlR family transcriptional regulator